MNRKINLPFGRMALILAALVAIAAVGISIWKNRSATEAEPVAESAPVGDVPMMITKLEEKLEKEPANADGWNMLGWSYFETGRYADAAKAYRQAATLAPTNAVYWSALGEALVLAGPGGVTRGAEDAFNKAIENDPKDHRARYFIGVKKDLAGDHKGAVEDWIAVLKDTPPGAPWEQPVRELLHKVATTNGIDIAGRVPPPSAPVAPRPDAVATAAIPGPSREQMQAASALPPAQQDEMVRGMVDRLAAKLKANPKDADGWIRLMRARMVIGDNAGATQALRDAKRAFAGDAGEQARLGDAARTLGVPGV
jgi:cytochrome c-type biogenesis protein CcmH